MPLPLILALAACFQTPPAPVVEPAPEVVPAPEVAPVAADDPLCADPFVADLARGARHWAATDLGPADFGTAAGEEPSLRDAEWLFGTWMMAAVGLGQHAALCPTEAGSDLDAMQAALGRMISPAGRVFDTREWGGRDLDERLGEDRGSVALLGYGGFALAVHRALDPQSPFAATGDAWAEALARRMAGGLVETYPDQVFPVDNAAGVAFLDLHDRTTGQDHAAAIGAGLGGIRAARDEPSGLLIQRLDRAGRTRDLPRGSGTFLTAWFLSRADPDLAADLYARGRDGLLGNVLGLTAMREYLPGREGPGDIDSGPLILGYSVSSTGFALGGAAAFGDDSTRDALLATAQLGGPLALGAVHGLASPEREGATGSHLGDAIMLAMVTANGRP